MRKYSFLIVAVLLSLSGCMRDNERGKVYFVAMKNHHYGVLNNSNQLVIPFQYDLIHFFSDSLALVISGDKYGFLDLNDKEVIPLKYDCADDFHNGVAPVKQNGKWGFINKKNKFIVECNYDSISSYSNGYWEVSKNGLSGFVDSLAKESIALQYRSAGNFYKGYASITTNKGNEIVGGLIDTKGREFYFGSRFSFVMPLLHGAAIALKKPDNKEVLINPLGEILYTLDDSNFSLNYCSDIDGFFYLNHDFEHRGVLNYRGKILLDTGCHTISASDGKYFVFRRNEKYGFSDTSGKIILSPSFADLNNFSEGYASFYNSGRGYIDSTGKIILSKKYDEAGPFFKGLAVVKWVNRYGVIDKNGVQVIPFNYENMGHKSWDGYFSFMKSGKWGIIDNMGKEIIPATYDQFFYAFTIDSKGNSVAL